MHERRTASRLVGRDEEIRRLIDHANDPTVGAVLLTGPPGVGTSLLGERAMIELAADGWRSVGLSATDHAATIPFASLSELIPDTLDRLGGLDDHAAGLAVLRAVEEELETDRAEPAVVFVDEFASVDEPSARLLVHLAKNRRVFLVATQSSGPGVAHALRLLSAAGVVELDIGPLDVTATTELAALLVGGPVDAGMAREVWVRSRGIPLFVRDLIDAGVRGDTLREERGVYQLAGQLTVGAALGRQIVHRLGVLSDGERRVLELLALAGDMECDDLADVVSGEVLEELERRDLLVAFDDAGRMIARLAHPLYGEAIVADLSPLVMRRRHGEIVELLEGRPLDAPRDHVVLGLARAGSGGPVDADELVHASRAAMRLDRVRDAAHLASVAHLQRGDEPTRTALAEALIRQGRFVEADELLAESSDDDADQWVRMRRSIRRASNRLWGFRDATAAWNIDAEVLEWSTDAEVIARVRAHQAWIAHCDGRSVEAVEISEPLRTTDHPDVRFAMATVLAPSLILVGRVEEGTELAQRAWDRQWGADIEFGSHVQHLIALGFGRLYLGDLPAARFIAGEAIRVSRERTEMTALLFFLDLAAWTELFGGRVAVALSYFEEAAAIAGDLALGASLRASLSGATICHAQLSEPRVVETAWQRVLDIPAAPGPRGDLEVALAEAWHVAATGDPSKAADLLAELADDTCDRGLVTLSLFVRLDAARLGYATPNDARRVESTRSICQGPLLEVLADGIEAAGTRDWLRLSRAADRLGDMECVLWAAELAAIAADGLAADGDQRSATAAQQISERFRRDAPDVRSAVLVRAHRVDPLTRREREIAARAVAGATNAEMAAQFHVSIRTVETHLQRIYRKLGVSSRRELADVFN